MRCHRCAPDAALTGPMTAHAHMAMASHRLMGREALAMLFRRTTVGTRTPYRLAVPEHRGDTPNNFGALCETRSMADRSRLPGRSAETEHLEAVLGLVDGHGASALMLSGEPGDLGRPQCSTGPPGLAVARGHLVLEGRATESGGLNPA